MSDPGPEPRWLDDEERAAWRAMAGIVFGLPAALDAQLQRDAGVTHFEYTVMAALSETPGRTLRMSYLAILANGSLSRLSHVVKRLERQGWVERAPDPSDGRYTTATLTEAGWEKVVATAPGHVEAVRQLVLDPLSKTHVRQMREIGTRISHGLSPEGSCAAWPSPTSDE
ncbi:MarR family winged helix-turn-helix transcriptional regulator [Kineosporia mesophila]|uniref:MarR family winged helix-turn-helix transcriptional regulator n=1 Tax=Kineosporia mesophila TaxID=566012 RepID=A0ABP6ZEJ3_9ACTN|nr:MarR family winged helix-turn-helix transcriptional regulator [Kineosporia mesophila]MCD5354223.1 MarR family winged helix-turn-helix transcriptional regulator [Kineosporia mesophila]